MMTTTGWIPREVYFLEIIDNCQVILDSEAHRRAPPLILEDSTVTNPPMFIYLVSKIINNTVS